MEALGAEILQQGATLLGEIKQGMDTANVMLADIQGNVANMRVELNAVMLAVEETIPQQLAEMEEKFDYRIKALKENFEIRLKSMDQAHARRMAAIEQAMAQRFAAMQRIADARYAQQQRQLAELRKLALGTRDPQTGENALARQAVANLYEHHRHCPVTAQEYETLQLPAAAYDALAVEALAYDDCAGENLIGWDIPNALTAAEYDALELTVVAFDAYQLTAWLLDQSGKTLLR